MFRNMAEKTAALKTTLAWKASGLDSSSSGEDAVVPGVNNMATGNLRPKVRLKRPREVRARLASSKPQAPDSSSTATITTSSKPQAPESSTSATTATTLSMQDLSQSLDECRLRTALSGGKPQAKGQVSLKDLCVEDKRRIANLIRELARVGDEKEKAREELEQERKDYEEQILKLVEQQEQILQERQQIEQQLQQCQQLLASHLFSPSPLPTHADPAQSKQRQPWHPPGHQLPLKEGGGHPQLTGGVVPLQQGKNPSSSVGAYRDFAMPVACGGQSMLVNVGSPVGRAGDRRQFGPSDGGDWEGAGSVPAVIGYHQNGQPVFEQQHHQQGLDGTSSRSQGHQNQGHQGQGYQNQGHLSQGHQGQDHQNQGHQGQGHQWKQRQPVPHPQPAAAQPCQDFFLAALQKGEPSDFLPAQKARKALCGDHGLDPQAPAPLLPPPVSKEEIMNRFLADGQKALASPKRRRMAAAVDHAALSKGMLPPIMSSTHKSMEIREYLSVDSRQDFAPGMAEDCRSGSSNAEDEAEEADAEEDDEIVRGGGEGLKKNVGGGGGVGVNRVAFVEGNNQAHVKQLYSPAGDGVDVDTFKLYRKMSQAQRKELLLQQRAALLQEQERLKHILSEQENMLREKQQALDFRAKHHGELELPERGEETAGEGAEKRVNEDEDPLGLVPQRLAIDAALERQRAIVASLQRQEDQQRPRKELPTSAATIEEPKGSAPYYKESRAIAEKGSEQAAVKSGVLPSKNQDGRSSHGKNCNPKEGKGRGGNGLNDIVKKLDYSFHSDSEDGLDGDEKDDEKERDDEEIGSYGQAGNIRDRCKDGADRKETELVASRHDACTSVSYHTLLGTYYTDGLDLNKAFSVSHSPPTHNAGTPGERTLTVLELINSLPSPHSDDGVAPTKRANNHRPRPSRRGLSSHRKDDLPPLHTRLSPFRRYRAARDDGENQDADIVDVLADDSGSRSPEAEEDEASGIAGDGGGDVTEDEELEESRILEDIFFLK